MTFKEIDEKLCEILLGTDTSDGYFANVRFGIFDKEMFADAMLLWEEFDHEWWKNPGSDDPAIRNLVMTYVMFVADTLLVIQSGSANVTDDEKAEIYDMLTQRLCAMDFEE